MHFYEEGRSDPGDVKEQLQLKIDGSKQAVKFTNYKKINQKVGEIQKQNIASQVEFF
jgi:hypothetical protein